MPRTDIKNLAKLLPQRDSQAEKVAIACMELRSFQRPDHSAIADPFTRWRLCLSFDVRLISIMDFQIPIAKMSFLVETAAEVMVTLPVRMFLSLLCNLRR